MTLTYTGVRSR